MRQVNRVAGRGPIARAILRNATVVLLYHDVSDAPSEFNEMFDLNVRPAVFAEQLDLVGAHFTFIGPEELRDGNYPTPAAVVTFDDGNASYFRTALPILKAKGITSVEFLNCGPVRGDVCWSGLVSFLHYREREFQRAQSPRGSDCTRFTEAQIARYLESVDAEALFERVRAFRGPIAGERDLESVAAEPLVYLGSHLYNHYNAAVLSADRLRTEFRRNQAILDAHPRGTRLFSYPFGQPRTCYNRATTQVLREEGADTIFSAYPLPNFGRRTSFYNRVAMTGRVRTEEDLFSSILAQYLPARFNLARERLV